MSFSVRVLGIVVALVGSPAPVEVDDAQLVMRWRAPPSCPDAIAVRERWTSAMGGAAALVRVHGEVTQLAEDAWSLRLEIAGPAGSGTRELVGRSCAALVEAAAAVVGIVARGSADGTTNEPVAPPGPVGAPAPVPRPPPTQPTTPAAVRPRAAPPGPSRRGPGWFVGVDAGLDVGLLPALGATLAARVGPSWRRIRVSLGALHAIDRSRASDAVRGSFALTAAQLAVAVPIRWRALVVAPAVGVELGLVRAEGSGVPITHVHRHLWVAVEGALELDWRFAGGWSLGGRIAAVVPMRPWEFAIGDDRLGRIGPVGGRFGLALGYESPAALRIPAAGGQR